MKLPAVFGGDLWNQRSGFWHGESFSGQRGNRTGMSMDESSSTNTGNFAKQAGTASIVAPVILIGMSIFLAPLLQGNQLRTMVFGIVAVVLIVAGFALGVIGLFGMKWHGFLWQSVVGTVINSLLVAMIVMNAQKAWAKEAPVTPARPQATDAAQVAPAVPVAKAPAAVTTAATPVPPTPRAALVTAVVASPDYDKDGVQFSYGSGWTVRERMTTLNDNQPVREILLQRQDNGGVIFFTFYPAGTPLLDLENYGRNLIQKTAGAADPQMVQITGNIGGVDQPGIRLHFTALKVGGEVFTGNSDFYRVRTPQHEVLVNTMSRGSAEAEAAKAIIASLKIDNGAAADAPTPATATMSESTTEGVKGEGFFIPAINRMDMVHDLKRNVLYITSGDSVLRYQLESKSFLAPVKLGGDLRGIDISPDNDHIAVADAAGGNGHVRIHVVDLVSGVDATPEFAAVMQESGTYSVAYGADGQIWVSSSMSGSGWVPLRKYNPPTQSVMSLPRVSPDTMLAASANRQIIGFAEGHNTPGSYGRILYRAAQLPPQPMHANSLLYEIGISRDGSQLAVPGFDGTILDGSQASKLEAKQILSAVYHPQRNYLFVSRAGTSLVSVYDTSNFSKVKSLDFGEPFEWSDHAFGSGRLKISPDGFYVFCTVKGGIRYTETGL